MAKSKPNRPSSTSSATTSKTVKTGPGGRKYTTKVEKTKPKYTFKIVTKGSNESAIPEEVDIDAKHFVKWPGILKILQLVVAIVCMILFSPPLTWFTRVLCATVASSFSITIFICLFYLFTLYRVVLPSWPWLETETIFTNFAAIAYLVSSVLQLIFTNVEEFRISLEHHGYYHSYLIAGAVGLINFVLYSVGGQFLYNKLKRQRARQPKVHIIRTTLDSKGNPIKKKVTEQTVVTIHETR